MASFSTRWTQTVEASHKPVLKVLHSISNTSARNPKRTIASTLLVSLGLVFLGISTNFKLVVDAEQLWTPINSKPEQHRNWINDQSGFPGEMREFILLFHQDSENVIGQEPVAQVFEAVDTLRQLPRYSKVCSVVPKETCPIYGVVNFWNDTTSIFEAKVSSDAQAAHAMSAFTFPDGSPVRQDFIFGFPLRDPVTNLLVSAQSYTVIMQLPFTDEVLNYETDAMEAIFKLSDAWEKDNKEDSMSSPLRVEVISERSFADEYEQAIIRDIPLVPLVFIVMSVFTCLVFTRWHDRVHSRSLLGLSAVVSIVLSLMSGYGLMFVFGVPFTSIAQILPFVLFGIGLDDAYVITGFYERTDSTMDVLDRIRITIDEVGMSISLTTLTSTIAFALGCISTVPAVRWLCLYAFPTIFIDFLFQLTFFVACIVLDEKRIQENRRDCCTWITAKQDVVVEAEPEAYPTKTENQSSIVDKFMGWYAKQLLRPSVKASVIVIFAGLLASFAHSASKLHQEFQFRDLLPNDSYVTSFFDALEDYTRQTPTAPYVYFRFVDQSDPMVHAQMEQYIEDLVKIEAIEQGPEFFWLRDFRMFVTFHQGVQNLTFNEQVTEFLNEPIFNALYRDHLVLDPFGSIIASRVKLQMSNVEFGDIQNEIGALKDQRLVTSVQPVNVDRDNWAFFSYSGNYQVWEFFSVSTEELTLTTVLGVAAVSGIALLFIPHWSAALFVLPLISILYVNLLGFLQVLGATVNPVSYVSLVMSIGLLVDFILHILVRYLELPGTREERTIKTLSTMGSSILLGGMSTFLGILPLAFSSSEIFRTVFIGFVGIVLLGATHGLVLLPVVLSMIGPADPIHTKKSFGDGDERPAPVPVHLPPQPALNEHATTITFQHRQKESNADPPGITCHLRGHTKEPREPPGVNTIELGLEETE